MQRRSTFLAAIVLGFAAQVQAAFITTTPIRPEEWTLLEITGNLSALEGIDPAVNLLSTTYWASDPGQDFDDLQSFSSEFPVLLEQPADSGRFYVFTEKPVQDEIQLSFFLRYDAFSDRKFYREFHDFSSWPNADDVVLEAGGIREETPGVYEQFWSYTVDGQLEAERWVRVFGVVPEPGTLLLALLGTVGLSGAVSRRTTWRKQ